MIASPIKSVVMKILFILALFLCSANPSVISGIDDHNSTDIISLYDPSNPKDFLTVQEEILAGLNPVPDTWEYGIFITNNHESKPISVKYRLYGVNQHTHTVEIGPSEKNYIIGYNMSRPRSLSILKAKFVGK